MNHICRVQIIDTTEQVVQYYEYVIIAEFFWTLRCENLLKVKINVIYHQKYLVKRFIRLLAQSIFVWNNDIMEFSCKKVVAHF